MKLELKHIAGYLPYGLKYQISMRNIHPQAPKELRLATLTPNGIDLCIEYGRLILHPLSDLTKEIEHNGERFVPVEEIKNIASRKGLLISFQFYTENEFEMFSYNGVAMSINDLPHWIVKKFEEWLLDIHNLIENGLAVDINMIEG